jgi:hypothetical protein
MPGADDWAVTTKPPVKKIKRTSEKRGVVKTAFS